ncbi:MAG: aromatic amino acid transport family protein [Christensenellales bacterium]|jgi:amino acid permease
MTEKPKQTSGLVVHELTFWEATMIIVGANIGSGILGLPYSARLGGFPILLLWLALAGTLVTVSMLYVAETSLRTHEPLQLPGLAEKYVGKLGSWLIFLSVVANSVGCMIAYMSGSGRILAELLGISHSIGSLLFAIPCVVVVYLGLKATGVAEKIISWGMIILLITIIVASLLSPSFDPANVSYVSWKHAVPIFNVALFCYIAQYAVPELARGLRHQPKKLAPSVILGMVMTFTLLALVPLAVLGITGKDGVTEVATIAWGNTLGPWARIVGNLFALMAMMTSYWAVGGSMLTNIVDKFHIKSETDPKVRPWVVAAVTIPPFALAYSGLVSFVDAIYLAGTFGGVIMSIIPVLMLNSARKNGDHEPEWTVSSRMSSKPVQYAIIIIFCAAAVYAILSMFGVLPAGW